MKLALSVSALSLTFCLGTTAFADATPAQMLEEAKHSFTQRDIADQLTATHAELDQIIAALPAPTEAADIQTKYDALILKTRSYYYQGYAIADSADNATEIRKNFFQLAMASSKAAKELNPNLAEGHYFYAISLGKWCENNGVQASLGKKGELVKNLQLADAHMTSTGAKGEELDNWGTSRATGRLLSELPTNLGGNPTTAIAILRKAWANGSKNTLNGIFLAQALKDTNNPAKIAEAKSILLGIKAQDLSYWDQDRKPETNIDLGAVDDLLASF